MYVCLCNGFTCRDVRKAAGEGAASVMGVHRALGTMPQCGRCGPTILGLVEETQGTRSQCSGDTGCASPLVAMA